MSATRDRQAPFFDFLRFAPSSLLDARQSQPSTEPYEATIHIDMIRSSTKAIYEFPRGNASAVLILLESDHFRYVAPVHKDHSAFRKSAEIIPSPKQPEPSEIFSELDILNLMDSASPDKLTLLNLGCPSQQSCDEECRDCKCNQVE